MAHLRLFGPAREAAGTASCDLPASNIAEILESASALYGERFTDVLARCRVWVNGEPAEPSTKLQAGDEVAVLPPVSGG